MVDPTIASLALFIGRIIVGGFYILNGISHFMQLDFMTQYAASRGVPAARLMVLVTGVMLLVGGLSILLGAWPLVGVIVLVIFLVPTTLIIHRFWAFEGDMRMVEMVNFMKNLGLLGSLLMFLAIPEPWPYSLADLLS